jgi:hypothetical protein
MGLFEGKTPAERNKTIAAIVLGVLSLAALYMAFGRGLFGGSTTTASSKPTPTPTSKTSVKVTVPGNQFALPDAQQDALNMTVPVVYNPASSGAPAPGRNIFAFYEPPPPTPYQTPSPTPPPPPVVPTPTPVPTPPFVVTGVSPQSVYAGAKGSFKLDVYGERFTPDSRIYFNQTEMPTKFVSPQALSTTIPESLVQQEGPRQIIVQTPDGKSYSPPFAGFTAMAPPKPNMLQYIGMIGRKRYNNDTAYFLQSGNQTPFGARLNDVVGGRFRIVDISSAAVTVEDTSLGFKHKIAMVPATGGTGGAAPPGGGFVPYNPSGGVQGLPNVPRMIPGQGQPVRPDQQRRPPPNSKDDVDDNDPNP